MPVIEARIAGARPFPRIQGVLTDCVCLLPRSRAMPQVSRCHKGGVAYRALNAEPILCGSKTAFELIDV